MEQKLHINLDDRTRVSVGGGSSDYNELSNKPQINGVTLENNKTAQELNLATNDDLRRFYDFYLKSVDEVYKGISPELELLENPVQVVIGSEDIGYINLDYPLDLVEGKNYHIKATIGYKNGIIEEKELDVSAVLQEEMGMVVLSTLLDENSEGVIADKVKIIVRDDEEPDFEADNNMSALYARSGTTDLSYVTFTSIVQKEKQVANLLKEPVTATRSNPFNELNYALGLEVGKSYNVKFKTLGVDGTETEITVTTSAIDASEDMESLAGAKILQIMDTENDTYGGAIYDGLTIDSEGEPVLNANKSLIALVELDDEVLTSITFESITAE